VAVLLVSALAIAATNLDGNYKFSSRTKDGKADMSGWQGTMTIKGNEMTRTYKSPDGKTEKFYTTTIKPEGNVYLLKITKAYKPEYVGNEHRNKLNLNGNTLKMEAEDGKFSETWQKQ
jgi:hypothetical protein